MGVRRTTSVLPTAGARRPIRYVIAVEGSKQEPEYFAALRLDPRLQSSRVHIETLPPAPASGETEGPMGAWERLRDYEVEDALGDLVERWLVVDVDAWPRRNLAKAVHLVAQRQWRAALSNPCFEVWLQLHVADDVVCGEAGSRRAAAAAKAGWIAVRPEDFRPDIDALREATRRAGEVAEGLPPFGATQLGSLGASLLKNALF